MRQSANCNGWICDWAREETRRSQSDLRERSGVSISSPLSQGGAPEPTVLQDPTAPGCRDDPKQQTLVCALDTGAKRSNRGGHFASARLLKAPYLQRLMDPREAEKITRLVSDCCRRLTAITVRQSAKSCNLTVGLQKRSATRGPYVPYRDEPNSDAARRAGAPPPPSCDFSDRRVDDEPERRVVGRLKAGVFEPKRTLRRMMEVLLARGSSADIACLPPDGEFAAALAETLLQLAERRIVGP